MKGFHYHVDLKSHDPSRPLPGHVEMTRHAWETSLHLILRLLGYVLLYEDSLEINGRPLNEDAPYQPAFGKWDLNNQPLIWGECQPEDYKRIKKIATKAPGSNLILVLGSTDLVEPCVAALKRNKLRPGRFKILTFEQEMVDEMAEHLDRRNSITLIQAEWAPSGLQLDFNGLWFESEFHLQHY